jgi:hypothetical protein
MTVTSSRLRWAALLVLCLAAPRPAAAQERSASDFAQARELFNRGLDRRDAGDLAGALEALRAAHALGGTPITGLELGRTYVAMGKLVEARETLLGIGRLPVQLQETARSTSAREDAARLAQELRARIPSLTVTVAGPVADVLTVDVDGVALPMEALGTARQVDPGSHAIVVTTVTGERVTASVDVAEGEARRAEVALPPAPPAPPAPVPAAEPAPAPLARETPPVERPHGPGPAPFVGFAVAGAGVAVGTVTGLLAMQKASSLKQACPAETNCPPGLQDDLSTGRALGTASTVAFIAAGAGAAAGVAGLLLAPRRDAGGARGVSAWIAPASAGLRVAF